MLKNFHINSTPVVTLLALVAISGYLWVEKGKEYVEQPLYKAKMQVATKTAEALTYLKNKRFKNVEFIDNLNDPNETGIIGQKYSHITTGSGSLPIKLSTTNPDFGALMVELLRQADIQPGDPVVVGMTGSFPALDIEMLLALEQMQAQIILIPSVTSSSWGANHPDYTILDMISMLKDGGFLKLNYQYASIGGNKDIGMSMSRKGIELVEEAIKRNKLHLINKGSLEENIRERLRIIDETTQNKPPKLYINIGGGVASNGSKANKNALKAGFHKKIKIRKLPDKYGMIYEMTRRDVPVIQLANIDELMKKYQLPVNPIPLPQPGKGKLYYDYRYNLLKVGVSTLVLLSILGIFIYLDKRRHRLGDSIISEEIQI
jgi:poly-gamma-glutamate system protein